MPEGRGQVHHLDYQGTDRLPEPGDYTWIYFAGSQTFMLFLGRYSCHLTGVRREPTDGERQLLASVLYSMMVFEQAPPEAIPEGYR